MKKAILLSILLSFAVPAGASKCRESLQSKAPREQAVLISLLEVPGTKKGYANYHALNAKDSYSVVYMAADTKIFEPIVRSQIDRLEPEELAQFTMHVIYLKAVIDQIENRLLKRALPNQELEVLFEREFKPIAFLRKFLEPANRENLFAYDSKVNVILREILTASKSMSDNEAKVFRHVTFTKALQHLEIINQLKALEKKGEDARFVRLNSGDFSQGGWDQPGPISETFFIPGVDQIIEGDFRLNYSNQPWRPWFDSLIGIDYQMDEDMERYVSGEEDFAKAGKRVQSRLGGIAAFVKTVNPKSGAKFVDLGSGFGLVGLVVGTLRPDIEFLGLEFVEHRVKEAQKAAEGMGMATHVKYRQSNLNVDKVPEADVYYMYAPFNIKTRDRVHAQLIKLGKHKPIIVVCRGITDMIFKRDIVDANAKKYWTEEHGGIFRSNPKPK